MGSKVIAIDGPAYVGKSQIAQAVSKKLGYEFINTGHMYRALARVALESGVSLSDEKALSQIPFEVWFENGQTIVEQNSKTENWTNGLNRVEIVESAGVVAKLPGVRARLTAMQRDYAKTKWIVMEGRDIGTVVFPDAEWKFFVTASEKVRAERILKMLSPEEKGTIDFAKAHEKILQIDSADKNRKIAPLRQADDAIVYDNGESPSAIEDAEEILNCMKMGKEKAPKYIFYGIHR
jgi:CMP/dCMP kinase